MNKLLLALALAAAPTTIAFADAPPKTTPAPDIGARLVPTMRDGKPEGLKVYAIKAGSRFAEAKFENGDTILKVNGEAVIETKGGLLLADDVIEGKADATVELVRKGSPMKLEVKAKH